MEEIKLSPGFVSGTVSAPPSKSFSHRALFAAALCGKKVEVKNISLSNDILSTVDCLKQLGADIKVTGNTAVVDGTSIKCGGNAIFNARESGTTLRFIIPVAAVLQKNSVINGGGRLPYRPIDEYFNLFDENGIEYSHEEGKNLPLIINGGFESTDFNIRCDKSSQYASGLMMCGMIKPVNVNITSEIVSKPYLDITAEVLRLFGRNVKVCKNAYSVSGGKTETDTCTVEGDWSQAAFYLCAAAINGNITLKNVKINSVQGDFEIVNILKRFGADVEFGNESVTVKKSSLTATDFDGENIPDLVPVLSVLACFAKGETIIRNVSNLELKESNRIEAICDEVKKLGGIISYNGNDLAITGVKHLKGGKTDSHNDHRIAMSMAVASVGCTDSVTIKGYRSVNKSYPTFFEEWSCLYE